MSPERQNEVGQRDAIALTPEQQKSRRARNIAIGLAIGCFIALFYVVTIVKLGGSVTHSPI
jgi:hypothetical protein